jgi:hypothetical protein
MQIVGINRIIERTLTRKDSRSSGNIESVVGQFSRNWPHREQLVVSINGVLPMVLAFGSAPSSRGFNKVEVGQYTGEHACAMAFHVD